MLCNMCDDHVNSPCGEVRRVDIIQFPNGRSKGCAYELSTLISVVDYIHSIPYVLPLL
jgi:hypothetical protein